MLLMSRRASKLLYTLRVFVALVWSCSAFLFWMLIRFQVLAWLAILPEWLARIAVLLASSTGIMILVCLLAGGSSLLLWHRFSAKQAASFAVLMPILLLAGSMTLGRIDMQGTEEYALAPARQGNVQSTREQLLIKMAQYGLPNELEALIRVGTNINARDPKGHSALYWNTELEIVKPLLQAGAKPDGESLFQAVLWGKTDTVKLLFKATSDDGKALVAEVGSQALQANTGVISSGEQNRDEIAQMLSDRGAKPVLSQNKGRL
jgi:uncharacterized protein